MQHTYKTEQWLPYPVEAVFDFFANPENLPRLMPSWQKARIEEAIFSPPPVRPGRGTLQRAGIAAGQGTRMIISFRPFPFSPVRVLWEAEITDFQWNDHFCDVQHRGPFVFWKHCHSLTEQQREGRGGTLLCDRVQYELPFAALGDAADAVFMRWQMSAIFRYRQKRTTELMARIALRT